jgi:hypothetical protein
VDRLKNRRCFSPSSPNIFFVTINWNSRDTILN